MTIQNRELYRSQEFYEECFTYNKSEGILYWKKRPKNHFRTISGYRKFNAVWPGKQANSISKKNGYCRVNVGGSVVLAHRVIWILNYGYNPEHEIDHIDRNPSNNRLENLREATRVCNNLNKSSQSNNTSGVVGVCWDRFRDKWAVEISKNGEKEKLGRYSDFNEAVKVRWDAEIRHDFPNCNTSSTAYNYLKENNLLSHEE